MRIAIQVVSNKMLQYREGVATTLVPVALQWAASFPRTALSCLKFNHQHPLGIDFLQSHVLSGNKPVQPMIASFSAKSKLSLFPEAISMFGRGQLSQIWVVLHGIY